MRVDHRRDPRAGLRDYERLTQPRDTAESKQRFHPEQVPPR